MKPTESLSRKLILAYIGINAITVFLLGAILIGSNLLVFSRSFTDPSSMLDEFKPFTPAVAKFLENKGSRNAKGLTLTIERVIREKTRAVEEVVDFRLRMAVVDAEGRIVAAVPSKDFQVGTKLASSLSPERRSCFDYAMQGGSDAKRLSHYIGRNSAILAMPVTSIEGNQLGALYAEARGEIKLSFLSSILSNFLPLAIALLLVGTGISVVVGARVAKNHAKSLADLAETAKRWKGGDFREMAEEGSSKEVGKLASELNAMAKQLTDMITEKERAASWKERDRLARDLHDTVKQQAFAASMELAIAIKVIPESTNGFVHITNAARLVESARKDLAATVLAVPAPVFEDLEEAICRKLDDWATYASIAWTAKVDGAPLPPMVRNTTMRILDEALSNISRHSGARSVNIEVAVTGDQFSLAIGDDGTGFDIRSTTMGMGIDSMRTRALSLPAGSFDIHSQPGSGTRIRVGCDLNIGSVG